MTDGTVFDGSKSADNLQVQDNYYCPGGKCPGGQFTIDTTLGGARSMGGQGMQVVNIQ
eukprot:CAMPEP_0173434118 /NCGR_PEP_ID=MMETSP1357-20121228/12029_1 /TAXON_ID=77926 /ORGANISM="Hemiselmis rufescens, Strain PCC563" /LENGTH=57 /DNA_ID=CAMNT_0014398929 /DNA_START=65 /DNA_END=238 /DNA_ORIENTATION=+